MAMDELREDISRRDVLKTGTATVAAVLAQMSLPTFVFPAQGDDEQLVPFSNMPPARPNMLDWENLDDDWITPGDQVFSISHYGVPEVDADKHALEITGLVEKPRNYSMEELKALPKQDEFMTLECSGNGAGKGFVGAIYNSQWLGTPLAGILEEAGIQSGATEIVFIGADHSSETLRKGTKRELKIEVPFGRSMSVDDAKSKHLLLAYQRDGKPLEKRLGGPLRLIVPGWYGIASVKWLSRIEVRNTRYMGRFMARDYVTVRGERHGEEIVYVETSVDRMNLKSMIARVTRGATKDDKIPIKAYGAVWSDDAAAIKSVEVKVDGGDWQLATLDKEPRAEFSWIFFSIDLGNLAAGKHTLVSRATDENGRVQPAAKDDEIALKKTYWEAYQQWPRVIELTV